jgi:hypothetical protein
VPSLSTVVAVRCRHLQVRALAGVRAALPEARTTSLALLLERPQPPRPWPHPLYWVD